MKPDNYVVIYKKKLGVDFSKFGSGDTIIMDALTTLSNPNDRFYLTSPDNKVIDAASYDLSLYKNSNKAKGGWTFERISVKAPCDTALWIASKDTSGGTPGRKNSVAIDSMDNEPPYLQRYYFKDEKNIVLIFNKSLNRTIAIKKELYQMSDNITVTPVDTVKPMFQIVQLKLSKALTPRERYSLTIQKELCDCKGIPLSKTEIFPIQMPEKLNFNDLIVNEILVNPEVGGSRFIELYNRSNKVLDIANLAIGDFPKADLIKIATNFLLFPDKYVVLTDNPLYIQKRYKAEAFRGNIIKNKLPTWDEKFGNVIFYFIDTTVRPNKKIVLDDFNYQKSWHNPLLANTEGVSLERVNPDDSSNVATNWQSAAQTVGYATPAQKNSQYLDPSVSSEPKSVFALEKKSFSPDEDGFEDFLRLNYRFDKAGFTATIRIFDDKGRLVKTLINNTLLSTEGTLKWEGDTDEGLKTRQGIYIIVIEWISPTGKVDRLKLACVVAGRL